MAYKTGGKVEGVGRGQWPGEGAKDCSVEEASKGTSQGPNVGKP